MEKRLQSSTGTIDSRDAASPRHPGRIQDKYKDAGIANINHGDVEMDLCVQLKVCEGCGCLWFRAQNHRGVYCHGCDARLRQFPSAESRKRRGPKADTLARILAVAHYSRNEEPFFSLEAAGG